MDNRENSWHGSWCGSNMSECLDLSKGFGNVKSLHPFLKKIQFDFILWEANFLAQGAAGFTHPFPDLAKSRPKLYPDALDLLEIYDLGNRGI